jgi:sulfate/thiosulfate transport system permease protein
MKRARTLPGFRLTMGVTLTYVSLLVLLPLGALAIKGASGGGAKLWATIGDARVLAACRLTVLTAFAAALVNAVMGFATAWVLERHAIRGKRFLDAAIDLPFALPTAVAGITLATLYAPHGWIGRMLSPLGIEVAYRPLGIVVALVFVGLPFVVRTVQPAVLDLDAAMLGASRWQAFSRVVFPALWPALLTGFTLSFARGLGEYGSVVFISGNMPMKTEVATLLIVGKLEQYDYAGAAAIGTLMLAASFVLLLVLSGLQRLWRVRSDA